MNASYSQRIDSMLTVLTISILRIVMPQTLIALSRDSLGGTDLWTHFIVRF